MEYRVFSTELAGRPLSIEFGKYAQQANGSAFVRYGDTVVMVNATMSEKAREGVDFFPLSVNKARAIEDLMDDPAVETDEGKRYVDLKWEYYFTIGKYHTRWSQLKQGDFEPVPGVQKGAEAMAGVADEEDYDIIDSDWYAVESGAGYRYMRMMIEECLSREIDVLLVHLPFPASEDSQMHGNTVSSIAEEYEGNS